jgi:ATP-binding cassette subfamily C (CFTR/MRP) protein 1
MAATDPEKANEGTAAAPAADPEIRATSSSSTDSQVEPKQYEEIRPGKEKAVEAAGDGAVAVASDGEGRPDLTRFRSEATSVTSAPSTHWPEQKPWYKQPNPMRWGKIPPVPKERVVSGEYSANFFSALIFHWMGPLMRVS